MSIAPSYRAAMFPRIRIEVRSIYPHLWDGRANQYPLRVKVFVTPEIQMEILIEYANHMLPPT
jgi:hypothetical protein